MRISPFGMYNTIHHSTPNLTMGAVPQVISALFLMLPADLPRRGSIPHSSFVEVGFDPLY